MTHKELNARMRERIVSTCVRLFTQQGFYDTRLSQITKEAGISMSSFQAQFKTKEGVTLPIIEIFSWALNAAENGVFPVDTDSVISFAVRASIQMIVTELSGNIRECYVAAYSNPDALEFVYADTAPELKRVFLPYNTGLVEADFYELAIGCAGMTRGYMARRCDQYLTPERKIRSFLLMTLRSLNVPDAEADSAVAYVLGMDIREVSSKVLRNFLKSLEKRFDFKTGARTDAAI